MSFCTRCGGANDPSAGFCRACGAALPVATGSTTPGAAVAPAPVVKKSNSGLKVVLILLAIFIGLPVLAGIIVAIVMAGKSGATASDAGKAPRDECDSRSFEYLLALQQGKPIAAAYWKQGVTPETLFDVRSFNVIKHGHLLQPGGSPYKIPRVYYEYEVESSTKGGFPIRKRWNIVLESDTKNVGGLPCAIVQLAEAE